MAQQEVILERTQEQRDADSGRQAKVADRRRESGLKAMKLHLDEYSYQQLVDLCISQGYPSPDNWKGEQKAELISRVLTYCLRFTASDGVNELAASRAGQELYSLAQIVKHRKFNAKEKESRRSERSNLGIAHFMQKYGYPTPESVMQAAASKRPSNSWVPDTNWIAKDVEYLLDDAEVTKAIEILDNMAYGSPTRKQKRETQNAE